MPTYEVGSVKAFLALVKKHDKERNKRIKVAIRETIKHGKHYVIQFTLPVAFGTLKDSLHIEPSGDMGQKLVADAPHAAPVENGSRPHWPPLAPLIAWVKLRGMQGLKKHKGRGTTTHLHAQTIGAALGAMEKDGALSIDAPEEIAKGIQRAIAKHGTKSHRYMASAQAEVLEVLEVKIKLALKM